MAPEISVIVPTWNRADTIAVAVTSALRQTLPPVEVLVCDDGSDDRTKDVVAALGDRRIVWCPGEHAGRAAIPRNRGLARSRGEWIAFLDSDDQWRPEKLERQMVEANRLRCLAAAANGVRKAPGQARQGAVLPWKKEKLTFHDLLATNRIICSTAVVHRSLLDSVGQFPEHPRLVVGEDYAFWLRVATCTDFAFVPELLMVYEDNPRNSIRRAGPGPFAVRRQVLADFVEWCAREGIDEQYREEAKKRLVPLGVIKSTAGRWWMELRDRAARERP